MEDYPMNLSQGAMCAVRTLESPKGLEFSGV